jgi:serine phosphatase RsbU (regulator of sigma subunit)
VLLSRQFAVVHANSEWLTAAGTSLVDALGRRVFDFPPASSPVVHLHLRALLTRVRGRQHPDAVTVRLPDGQARSGSGPSRTWRFSAALVPGDDGLLLLRTEDLTGQAPGTDDERPAPPRVRDEQRVRHVESALHTRTEELARARAELRALREHDQTSARSLGGLATTVSALAAAESREDLLRHLFGHARLALSADALALALFEPGGGQLAVVDAGGPGGGQPRTLPLDPQLAIAAAAAGRAVYQPDAGRRADVPPLPGLRAWAALPLRSGRRPLGSLTIGWHRPHPLGEEEVRVLEALAAQCAQALDRVARLETERRRAAATRSMAEVLQRSLLTDPPQVDGIEIAVRYRPAAREAQIGGDWYDAFLTPGGALGVAVGDVTGHDRTAAALAGQLRNMLRGIVCALDGDEPARVLTTLDRALDATGVTALATALVARVERAAPDGGDDATFRWSSAGHPPPLLVGPDGRAQLLQPPADLLLGVEADTRRHTHAVVLRPGATVLLYTDGLVERRGSDLDAGFDRLLQAAAGLQHQPVDRLCDELFTRLDPELTDDIAMLALRTGARRGVTGG